MKILNLFAGLGGNRVGFSLTSAGLDPSTAEPSASATPRADLTDLSFTAIELDEKTAAVYKTRFPQDEVIVADAYDYIIKHYTEFDFIWASPPCQTHSRARVGSVLGGKTPAVLPDFKLYSLIAFLQTHAKGTLWVIENVIPYYKPLTQPTARIGKHLFWANFEISALDLARHAKTKHDDKRVSDFKDFSLKPFKLTNARQAVRNQVDTEIAAHVFRCALAGERA